MFHVLGSSILAVPTVDYALWSLEALLTWADFVCSEEIQLSAFSKQRQICISTRALRPPDTKHHEYQAPQHLFLFFLKKKFWPQHPACGILLTVPQPGIDPWSLQWKCRVLTTNHQGIPSISFQIPFHPCWEFKYHPKHWLGSISKSFQSHWNLRGPHQALQARSLSWAHHLWLPDWLRKNRTELSFRPGATFLYQIVWAGAGPVFTSLPNTAGLAPEPFFPLCMLTAPHHALEPSTSLRYGLSSLPGMLDLSIPTGNYGLPRWLSGKESACQCRRRRFHAWVGKIPWRRKGQPTPVFLPGEPHQQRSLAGCSPWDCKELDMT